MFRFTSLLIAGCVGAMISSQAPEFMQQYKQRLGGAIDELAQVVRHFDNDANKAGMDRASAIERYTRSGDSFFVQRGHSMQTTINRWHNMSDHWRSITRANIFAKLPVFISGADTQLLKRTWDTYKPAIPTTPEGLAYSGAGFLFTHLIFGGILSLLGIRRHRPVRRERSRETERYADEHYYEDERPARRRPKERVS